MPLFTPETPTSTTSTSVVDDELLNYELPQIGVPQEGVGEAIRELTSTVFELLSLILFLYVFSALIKVIKKARFGE